MSRISKDLANTISKKLTLKLDKKIHEKNKELKDFATEIWHKRIPNTVQEFNKTNPNYVKKCSRIKVFNNGFNGEAFNIHPLPCTIDIDLWSGIPINDLKKNEAVKLKKLHDEFKEIEHQKEQLQQSIYNALLQLVTYKRIIEQFPEAAPYLERKDAYAIAIPVEDIRKQLQEI